MSDVTLTGLEGQAVSIDQNSFQKLQASLRRPLLSPSDAGFDEACRLWNGMISARPALVCEPTGNADVIACIDFARTHGILLSAKCGGHNVSSQLEVLAVHEGEGRGSDHRPIIGDFALRPM